MSYIINMCKCPECGKEMYKINSYKEGCKYWVCPYCKEVK